MTDKPKRIRTLARFQKEITELKDGEFVYRGQSDEGWSVNSSAYRRLFLKSEGRESFPNELIKYNKGLLDNARNYDEALKSETALELLAHLQHQGAATSLIDFSRSALVALWFACQDRTKNGKVFCIDIADVKGFVAISPRDMKKPIEKILGLDLGDDKDIKTVKWQPSSSINLAISQHSIFIFNKSGEIKNTNFDKMLIITKDYKEKILKDLGMLSDITETGIFLGVVRSNAHDKHDEIETVEENFQRALDYHQTGRFEEAIKDYDLTIELDPDNAVAYYNRGSAKDDLKQFSEAIKDYDRAIELKLYSAEIYYSRGVVKTYLKHFGSAIEDFDRDIELEPYSAAAYTNRGAAKNGLKRFESAIEDLDLAIKLQPEYAETYTNRGAAKNDLGRFKEAIEDLDRAIELDPDFAKAYNNRGNSKACLVRFREAIADFDRAIELNPDFAEAYHNRGNVKTDLGHFREAIADFDLAIELTSDSAKTYNSRGAAKKYLERFKEAVEDFDRAIELDPDFSEAYSNRGTTKARLEHPEEAIKDFDRAVKLNPDDANAYNNRGIAKILLKHVEEGIKDLEQARDIYNKRGNIDKVKKCQEAIDAFKNQ